MGKRAFDPLREEIQRTGFLALRCVSLTNRTARDGLLGRQFAQFLERGFATATGERAEKCDARQPAPVRRGATRAPARSLCPPRPACR